MPDFSPLRTVATEGTIASDQPAPLPRVLRVGPATEGQHNTLGERLIPKGCFRMEDVRFEFDSSVVRPETREDMPALADLIERHSLTIDGPPEEKIPPPMTIFGHADPVGDDDYNKVLSGRRALAVYGMLVRDTDVWEELFSKPAGGDNWGTRSIQIMLAAVGESPGPADGVSGSQTSAAVKSFQSKNGLGADGVAGPNTRKVLFRAYMDFICGPRLELDKEKNFLARHADGAGLKGDVQGCSEFNPVLMFSREENEKFAAAPNKSERNNENAPNRRVMILLFTPGRRVNPEFWPCPRVKEGVAACKKRFFPDADKRRSFQEERREFSVTRDTFACRFYQTITDDSPCERPKEPSFCCKHRGVVVNNVDPLQIGRMQVRVPDVLGDETPFAMPCVPYAGPDVGFVALPPIGAEVWVDFEEGDRARPVWSGAFWSPGDVPPDIGNPEKKVFKTESMTLILDDQGPGSVKIEVGNSSIRMNADGILQIQCGPQRIELTAVQVVFNQDALIVLN